jgi:hypothetical protein
VRHHEVVVRKTDVALEGSHQRASSCALYPVGYKGAQEGRLGDIHGYGEVLIRGLHEGQIEELTDSDGSAHISCPKV